MTGEAAGFVGHFHDTGKIVKATNPKDRIASNKLPLDLVPDTLSAFAALAFVEGAAKYGAYNWRVAGVRASVYRSALDRHLKSWWNGEDVDPLTGVPHLASIIACAGILLDAGLAQKLTDDRPPKVGLGEVMRGLEAEVARVRSLFAEHAPIHWTAENSAGQ
ncbi:dATP/dGTP diphosphohydrolase domain-containing protein [Bosea thiooxidans]